jgi:NADH-quinone oxidoreductase subunit L
MKFLPLAILFAPLAAAVLNHFVFKGTKLAVWISVAACAAALAGSTVLFLQPADAVFASIPWLKFPGFSVSIGCETDMLARLMLLMVTGVGLMIHLFAYGYMKEDPGLSRFFAKLSLFMFSMLGIVLADNLVMMFIFWELVGLSSYLLIGFWFERPSAAEASKKAFLANRLGDFGFMLGILLVWQLWHTVDFGQLKYHTENYRLAPENMGLMTLAALGLFCGCIGKSAQFPLHVWLPDAMEGPTPVSALIHAATMVAAGVYMLCRVFFLLELSPLAMTLIALIGCITAVFAALIATQQDDIKRILAYSTLSQLGYMVMAVGLAAPAAAMFHLTTHAFFKALLFLGAGSVIHSLHHEQNIWKMGGLSSKMKITFATFLIGTAALTGFPLLSGFYSKEEILLAAWNAQPVLFWAALATAGLTAYYMSRLFIVAFLGRGRSDAVGHAHESPAIMTGPLIVLALLSVAGGYLGLNGLFQAHFHGAGHEAAHHGAAFVMGASVLVFAVGVGAAWFLYRGAGEEKVHVTVFRDKFYSDEIYEMTFLRAQTLWARALAWTDRWVVEGILVRLTSLSVNVSGEVLRLFQGGNLQAYALIYVLGVLGLVYWIFRMN